MKKILILCLFLLSFTQSYGRGELGINFSLLRNNSSGDWNNRGIGLAVRAMADVDSMIAIGGGFEALIIYSESKTIASPLMPVYFMGNFQIPFRYNKVYIGGAFGGALSFGKSESSPLWGASNTLSRLGIIAGGQLGYMRCLPNQVNISAEIAYRYYKGEMKNKFLGDSDFSMSYIRYGIGISVLLD